ncbi:hypothetical protein BGK53_22475 [Shigella sp. FC1139]|nr:hypothetical protein BGK53_22475 [Shigella sp. FC1139]
MSQAIYRKEYATSNEKIKNYALYYHEQAQNIIQRHQDGLGNKNIDIAFIRGLTLNRTVSHVKSFLSDKSKYNGH